MNPTSIHEDVGSIPGLISVLRIWYCCELRCRSQTWLRSHVAVVVVQVSSFASESTHSLGSSICHEHGSKERKKKAKKREREREHRDYGQFSSPCAVVTVLNTVHGLTKYLLAGGLVVCFLGWQLFHSFFSNGLPDYNLQMLPPTPGYPRNTIDLYTCTLPQIIVWLLL